MTLGRLLISAMAMVAATVAHPAPVERSAAKTENTESVVATLIDADVTEPMAVPRVAVDLNNAGATVKATTNARVGERDTVVVVKAGVTTKTGKSKGKGKNSDSAVNTTVPGAQSLPGISYAPYRADNQCKTADDIYDDFSRFNGLYSYVRIYGTDCNQVEYVYKAAKSCSMKLFLGIWDINNVENEANKIISGIDGDWDIVHTVSVGNELVNGNQATPQEVISAVKQARPILRAAGYQGPVVTVDTFIAVEAHPELCEASDYCAVNAHAFFDSTSSANEAGPWLVRTVNRVKAALTTDKHVIITETGWPTAGSANGLAVPGLSQQRAALKSLKASFANNPGDIILFSAYNDLWKPEVDRHWGIDGAVSTCDQ